MKTVKEYSTKIGGVHKALMLVKEKEYNYNPEISSPREVYELIQNTINLGAKSEEYMYMLCLNTKNSVTGVFQCSMGSLDRALVDPAVIMKRALLCNAKSIILTHNHPSGNSEPSAEDINITKKINSCCDLLGISLLDHMVIGDDEYTSMKQQRLF